MHRMPTAPTKSQCTNHPAMLSQYVNRIIPVDQAMGAPQKVVKEMTLHVQKC